MTLFANAYGHFCFTTKRIFETLIQGNKEKAMQPSYRQERDLGVAALVLGTGEGPSTLPFRRRAC